MKVTHVSLMPTELAEAAGRPKVTPEMLAAVGARYSRTPDGLETILSKADFGNKDEKIRELLHLVEHSTVTNIDEQEDADCQTMDSLRRIFNEIREANLEKSIDSIFNMLDYGHQSIADMVPIAMFMDGLSIYAIYYIWYVCQMASGQETSTRYCKFGREGLITGAELGIPSNLIQTWEDLMLSAIDAYESSLEDWNASLEFNPRASRIPTALLESEDPKDKRKVERMMKNYGLDRARAFIPVALKNNMMLIMNARSWAQLCQHLLSHPLQELNRIGREIVEELKLVSPRMVKYARTEASFMHGIGKQFNDYYHIANRMDYRFLKSPDLHLDRYRNCDLQVWAPEDHNGFPLSDHYADDLRAHHNRYAWIGDSLKRTTVRIDWDAVDFACARDMNRHRTGNRYMPMVPVGFYCALDQLPDYGNNVIASSQLYSRFLGYREIGRLSLQHSLEQLLAKDATYIYWTLLGTQYQYEYTVQADKFIYICELRTGDGAHYRYAQQFRDALAVWKQMYPDTVPHITEGNAEPE